MRLAIRDKWSKFKRGMMQFNVLFGLLNIAISAFTAVMVGTGGALPWWVAALLVAPLIGAGATFVWMMGAWDFNPKKKRNFLHADVHADPLTQTNVNFNIEVCKKLGIDPKPWEEWKATEE